MTIGEFRFACVVWCYIFDARETSGARSPFHNRMVGGVPHSAHLIGAAADMEYRVLPPETERRKWAAQLGLYLHVEDDHDHLQPLDWPAG